MALNSIMNPWIYLSLNRDLQLSLYYCCFPCQSSNNCQTSSHENVVLPENQNSKNNDFLRPRSFTASEAQIARDRFKMRPFSNNSYQRPESTSINNDIPNHFSLFIVWENVMGRLWGLGGRGRERPFGTRLKPDSLDAVSCSCLGSCLIRVYHRL